VEKQKELAGTSIHGNTQALPYEHFNLLTNQQRGVQVKLGCLQKIAQGKTLG
jgi:hypothetical protein